MGTLDDREFALIHMFRFKELAETGYRAYRKQVKIFPEITHPHCMVLWEAFLKLAQALKTLDMTKTLLVRELKQAFPTYIDDMTPEQYARGIAVIQALALSRKSQMKLEEGKAYVEALIKTEIHSKVLDKIRSNTSLDSVRKAMQTADDDVQHIIPSAPSDNMIGIEFPLQNIAKYIGKTKKVPFGISFLDKLTGGGCVEGTVMGFLGIQGGGKTMMTVQMAIASAKVARQVLWLTYEQEFSGDIAERAITRVTGTMLGQVRQKAYSQLDEHTRNKIEEAKSKIGQYLAIRNFAAPLTDANGTPLPDEQQMVGDGSDIRAIVQYMKRIGRPPKIILFDWMGEAVERICIARGIDPKDNFQTIASEYLRDINSICADYNCIGIVFHQIAAVNKTQPPKWKPTAADAERFKAFSRNMFGCFVMGNAKVNGSGARWLLTDKLRNGVPAETVIRMVGEEAQFVEAEGWVIGPHGDFEDPSVTESSENAVEDKEARIRSFTQQFFGTDQESEGF